MKSNLLKSIFISLILVMGVNNAWAGEGFYGIYIKYNHNGTAKTSNGEWTNPLNLGTLTSDFKVTDVYLKVWWENWSPTMSAQLHYWKDGNEQWSGTFKNVKSTGGNNREVYVENWNKVLASTTETSGSHEIMYKWEAYFSSVTHTLPSSGTKKITYTVAPPAVKSFTVTHSGDLISGSGEQDDPYIIRYNGSLTLTLSGSQNHTDANSTLQYNTSGTWNTTTSRTISNITSATKKSVTVKMRCHNSTASLSGTESSKTIYYRAEDVYTVTINNDGHGTTSPTGAQSNVGQVTGLSIKATPAANYEFVNWTITSGSGSFDSATSASTTFKPTSAATIQANFRSTATHSLTVAAGAGIASVTGSTDPVTLGSSYAITATPETGYSFSTWTASPAANATFASATSANTNVTVKNGSVTVTASATENLYTITVQSSNNSHGTVTKSADKAGIATSITITATPESGYRFVNWTTATAGIAIADANNASTTVNATAAGTITANFEEIPLETIYFVNKDGWNNVNVHLWDGDADDTTWPGVSLTKADFQLHCCDVYYYSALPGSYGKCIFSNNGSNQTADLTWTAGKYFYGDTWKTLDELTYEVQLAGTMNSWTAESLTMADDNSTGSLTVNLDANQTYEFKIIVDNDWHGNTGTMTYGNSTDWTMSSSENTNCKITTAGSGNYTFTYNVCTAKVTVTYPTSYTVTYSHVPTAAADAPTNPSITSGKYVAAGTSVTFTAMDANNGYTWKGWYNNEAGDGDALTTDKVYTKSITANTTIYAVYTVNTYSITYNLNDGSGTMTPTEYQVTTATFNLPTPTKTGYTFAGWFDNEELTGDAVIQITNGTTDDKEFWAKWTANTYTVKFNANGGSGSMADQTFTYNEEEKALTANTFTQSGYDFVGWNTLANGTGTPYTDSQKVQNLTDEANGTITLYAQWQGAEYTVTLDQTGAAKEGSTTSVDANFEGNMPAITGGGALPTPQNGYAFMGYWDEKDGKGTQYYKADGTSARTWNKAEDATLYAYFKAAEITINLNAASFEPNSATPVIATATLTPTPVGTTSICWELLYNDDTPVAEHDPQQAREPNQVQFNINDLATGTYQIKATLREGTGCTGTIISHATQVFTITSDHTITIKYIDENGQTIKASTTQSAHVSSLTEITAPEIIGYTFKEWEAGDGVSIKDATDGKKNTVTIEYNAYYDGYLKAIYTINSNIIYFYNTLGWENVYVYFYNDANGYNYWTDNYGTGAHQNKDFGAWDRKPFWEMEHGQMEQITGTNIWYFQMKNKRSKVAFANVNQTYKEGDNINNTTSYFQNANVVYRYDLDSEGRLPMFVPDTVQSHYMASTKSTYYNHGYWMNYPDNSGYKLHIYDDYGDELAVKDITYPFGENTIFPLQIKVELNAENIRDGAHKMWFRVQRNDNRNFGGDQQKLPAINSTKQNGFLTDVTDSDYKIQLITPIAGTYTFTLDYKYDSNAKEYQYHIDVQLPAEKGDYRILYRDAAEKTWSGNAKTNNWYHASRVIKKGTDTKDIISFFINKDVRSALYYQTVASIDDNTGNITWDNNEVQFNNIDWSQITTSGVYNFVFVQDGKGISLENTIEPYTGNYYIRVDAVGGKWDNYKTHAENRMTYSAFSESPANSFGEQYSHYVTKYCEKETNIKFTIANDYSPCISDTLIKDIGSTINNLDQYGTLIKDDQNNDKYSANVRFMWNRKTNKISRAYIGRAYTNDFLVIKGNKQLQKSDGKTLKDTIVFFDTQNWIYEVKMKVQPTTRVKVYAAYPAGAGESGAQYFCGAYNTGSFTDDTDSKLALGGSLDDNNYYSIRVLYDFKTNRLLMAWIPDSEISDSISIDADMMIIRDHQNAAQCITFHDKESELSNIKTVYGAMRFNRWVLNNRGGQDNLDAKSCGGADTYDENITKQNHPVLTPENQKSQYERALYFISFPFDVHLSDVFGFGTYGQHWIIEYYDGLKRAKEGYWIDSDPNWKYVTDPANFVLEKYKGYILCLNLGKMAYNNTDFWAHNISQVELFFPSTTTMSEISQTEVTMPALGDEYLCTINRNTPEGDRRVKDSYWRCIGVPSYANYSNVLKDEEGDPIQWQTSYKTFPFLYRWNKTDNTLTPQSTTNFKFETMHAYLVQNGGEIHWSAVNATPDKPNAGIIAKVKETTRNYEWRITLTQGEKEHDQAFVRLSDNEQVTTEFDFNQDLSKEFNYGRSDIYTLIGYEKAAANSLPLSEQTTLIPLGLAIEYNGDYTIAMPDGTANIGVTLIDTESNTRTNLSAGMEYTLTLKKGDYNNRFFIEISPIQQTPTDIEYVENSHDNQARKVLIDNILYIVRDGQMFDARGARVK